MAAPWPSTAAGPSEPPPTAADPWLPLVDDPEPALDRMAQGLPGPGDTGSVPFATPPLELASGPAGLELAAVVAEPTSLLLAGFALLGMAAGARRRLCRAPAGLTLIAPRHAGPQPGFWRQVSSGQGCAFCLQGAGASS